MGWTNPNPRAKAAPPKLSKNSQALFQSMRRMHAKSITPEYFRKAGITLRPHGVGKGGSPEGRFTQAQAQLNQQALNGTITPESYVRQSNNLINSFNAGKQAQSKRFGKIASVQGQSDRVNQRTERAIQQSNQTVQTKQNKNISVELKERLSFSDGGQTTHTFNQTSNGIQTSDPNNFGNFVSVARQGIIPPLTNYEKLIKYADNVDSGRVEKPKPFTKESVQYYYSQAIKPISDIPYTIDELVRGTDHKLQPTFLGTGFDDAFNVGGGMWNQRKGTPENIDVNLKNYFMKDPLRTLVQIPSEIIIVGAISKGIKYGGKGIQLGFSKLPQSTQTTITNTINQLSRPVNNAISKIFPSFTISKVDKSIFYQGVTINNKPIIGVVNKKLVFGTPNPKTIPLSKINLKKSKCRGTIFR